MKNLKQREVLSMNFDWRFHRGDILQRNYKGIHAERFAAAEWLKAGNHGLSYPDYPDDDWESVQLPHDFVIEGEFSPEANTVHGSLPVGISWYRKTFSLPPEDGQRRILIEFDGVFRNSTVWVNGHYVGANLSGYTCFQFDITDVCNVGGLNTVAVRADASEYELWSYEGGGIYRNVRLIKTGNAHVDYCGTFVTAEVSSKIATPEAAAIDIETTVVNSEAKAVFCEVSSQVLDPTGAVVGEVTSPVSIGPYSKGVVAQKTAVQQPLLWDVDSPYLYQLYTKINVNGQTVDDYSTNFGIRFFDFDPEKGFFLNGRHLKLKGTCCHQDHGAVGTAVPNRLQEWRIEQLKQMGSNAIRTSHNPADPALLDVCDRLGMLVMDENRILGTSEEILGQLENLVRRGRNHPSVILWSIGNEDMRVQDKEVGIRMMQRMQDLVHTLDPTRKVTYAMNGFWIDYCDIHDRAGFRLDVFGTNYTNRVLSETYDQFHQKYPDWPLLGSETGGSASTRGLYEEEQSEIPLEINEHGRRVCVWSNPKREGIVSAYGETYTAWGYSIEDTWRDCAIRPFMAGTFIWTGFDYRGETFPYGWPAVITRYGIMDLCGFPKDAYFYLRAWWRSEPLLHLFPHWNWTGKEGDLIDVWAYTNCVAVELFLNDRSLGTQEVPRYGRVQWQVPYESGKLFAKGYDAQGRVSTTTAIHTAGEAAKIQLVPDRTAIAADNEDLVVVNVAIVDDNGNLVPRADNLVQFEVSANARVLGVGNGNPISHEPDKAKQRKAYHGLCQIIVQTSRHPGQISIGAVSPGLESAQIVVAANPVVPPPYVPSVQERASAGQQKKTDIDDAL